MRPAWLFIASFLLAGPAVAEEYEQGPHGGLMIDVAGIDAELMTAGNTVTINVFVPNTDKPVSTKGFTSAVLSVSGSSRETVLLTPERENSLKAMRRCRSRAAQRSH